MSSADEGEKKMLVSRKGSMSPESCSEEGEDGKAKVFTCSMCSYRTDRKNNLKRHTLTMHEMSQALLECCNLRFLNKAELRMHTQKYHADGYYCEVCDRNFCRKALLKRHFSVHSGYKEFSCHFCGYETSHKSNLERHMRVHRKTASAPSAVSQQMNHSGFLPKFSTATTHLPPSVVAFRTSLMTSQSHPILPSVHSHPPVFPLMNEHHTHVHPPLGSSWPVLHPPTASGRQLVNPFCENQLSSETLLRRSQQQAPLLKDVIETTTAKDDPSSTALTLTKKKKNGPRKDFSVSALLGDDLKLDDNEEKEEQDATIVSSQHQLHNDSRIALSTSKSSVTSGAPPMPRIQRPTPIHAYTRPFPHPGVPPFATTYLPGAIQAPPHSQGHFPVPRSGQIFGKSTLCPLTSSSMVVPTSASSPMTTPRAFTTFRAPLVIPSSDRAPGHGNSSGMILASERLRNHALEVSNRMQMASKQQSPEAVVTMSNNGSLNANLSSQTAQLQYTFNSNAQPPHRPQTPKNDTLDSGASSGYGSPGLEESPRFKGQSLSEVNKKTYPLELYESTQDGGISSTVQVSHREMSEEEQDELMEVDQEQYIPKKLRASKKFQSTP